MDNGVVGIDRWWGWWL